MRSIGVFPSWRKRSEIGKDEDNSPPSNLPSPSLPTENPPQKSIKTHLHEFASITYKAVSKTGKKVLGLFDHDSKLEQDKSSKQNSPEIKQFSSSQVTEQKESPLEMLISQVYDQSRCIPPFPAIGQTVQRMFALFGFKCFPAWDLKVPESDKYFLIKNVDSRTSFQALVITENFTDELMRIIAILRIKYHLDNAVVITPDIAIFGPTPDDIPPEGIPVSPFNQSQVNDLLSFLAAQRIVVVTVSVFIQIFKMHLQNSISQTYFDYIFSQSGLLSSNIMLQIQQSLDDSHQFGVLLLQLIRDWEKNFGSKYISIKSLKKNAVKKQILLSETVWEQALDLLGPTRLGLIDQDPKHVTDYRLVLEKVGITDQELMKMISTAQFYGQLQIGKKGN